MHPHAIKVVLLQLAAAVIEVEGKAEIVGVLGSGDSS